MQSFKAFLVAPFPVALFQSVVVALWPKEGQGVFENPPSMFVALCLYFYIFGLLLGLPTWLFLRKKYPGRRTLALIGLIVGIVPVGAALSWMISQQGSSAYVVIYNLLLFGVGGVVAGWTYWRLSQHRPATA